MAVAVIAADGNGGMETTAKALCKCRAQTEAAKGVVAAIASHRHHRGMKASQRHPVRHPNQAMTARVSSARLARATMRQSGYPIELNQKMRPCRGLGTVAKRAGPVMRRESQKLSCANGALLPRRRASIASSATRVM